MTSQTRRVILHDPDYDPERLAMKLRLTYEGPLLAPSASNRRAQHKHEIRQRFHPQLKRLWDEHPYLATAMKTDPMQGIGPIPLRSYLMNQFHRLDYNFVPLVTEELSLMCGIDILFLRPARPGQIIYNSGDIDNRLKTLFDSLRMPEQKEELGGYEKPNRETEFPFYCLLQDDKLISHVSVETDMLLEAMPNSEAIDDNDVRLVISVNLTPYGNMGWHNIAFAAS